MIMVFLILILLDSLNSLCIIIRGAQVTEYLPFGNGKYGILYLYGLFCFGVFCMMSFVLFCICIVSYGIRNTVFVRSTVFFRELVTTLCFTEMSTEIKIYFKNSIL